MPLPLLRRLKSGAVVGFDMDPSGKTKAGVAQHGGLYLPARGNRCVPIVCFYSGRGDTKAPLAAVEPLLESIEIPGAGDAAITMFDTAELAGNRNTSSMSPANYVTSSGAYAGGRVDFDGGPLSPEQGRELLEDLHRDHVDAGPEGDEGGHPEARRRPARADPQGSRRPPQVFRVFGVGGDAKGGIHLNYATTGSTLEKVSTGGESAVVASLTPK